MALNPHPLMGPPLHIQLPSTKTLGTILSICSLHSISWSPTSCQKLRQAPGCSPMVKVRSNVDPSVHLSTFAGPNHSRDPLRRTLGCWSLPKKSALNDKTGPVLGHSSSRAAAQTHGQRQGTRTAEIPSMAPSQLAATCLFGLEQEIHFSTIYTADLRNKLITATKLHSHTVQLTSATPGWDPHRGGADGWEVRGF
jgi:hypothetical protein